MGCRAASSDLTQPAHTSTPHLLAHLPSSRQAACNHLHLGSPASRLKSCFTLLSSLYSRWRSAASSGRSGMEPAGGQRKASRRESRPCR